MLPTLGSLPHKPLRFHSSGSQMQIKNAAFQMFPTHERNTDHSIFTYLVFLRVSYIIPKQNLLYKNLDSTAITSFISIGFATCAFIPHARHL